MGRSVSISKGDIKEEERLKALDDYNILDTLPEADYDQITQIASQICNTSISLITLIDDERQWFKSATGIEATETPRELAFCTHSFENPGEVMVVNDSRKDQRFKNNPYVIGDPNVIFYAGAPLNTPQGHTLGTLCVIDSKPKKITEVQKSTLKALANQVVTLLELRKKNKELVRLNHEILKVNDELDKFSVQLSHDLCTPTRAILMVNQWIQDDHKSELSEGLQEKLDLINSKAKYMHALVNEMLNYAKATRSDIKYEDFNLKKAILKIIEEYNQGFVEKIDLINMDQKIYQSRVAMNICFQNLLSNSIKYNDKEKCRVAVELDDTDTDYLIYYEDNGPGIDKKYHKKVFEIYETLGPKTDTSTGIGLATVRGTLEKLGGNIRFIENRKLKGVSFLLTIPKV